MGRQGSTLKSRVQKADCSGGLFYMRKAGEAGPPTCIRNLLKMLPILLPALYRTFFAKSFLYYSFTL